MQLFMIPLYDPLTERIYSQLAYERGGKLYAHNGPSFEYHSEIVCVSVDSNGLGGVYVLLEELPYLQQSLGVTHSSPLYGYVESRYTFGGITS